MVRIKLVAVDLDGTLYNAESKISIENKQAIAACLKQKIMVTLATAKPIYSVQKTIKELNLIHPQIVSGGAGIIDCRQNLLFKLKIPAKCVREVVYLCRKHHKGLGLSAADGIVYYEQDHPGIDRIAETGDKVVKVADLIAQGFAEDALLLTVTIPASDSFSTLIAQKIKHKVKLSRGGPNFFTILNKDAGKTFALKKIMEMFKINRREVLSIGDSPNDVGMLKLAGTGIAVANALESVKKAADYLVSDNDHSGVAEAIQKFVLQ